MTAANARRRAILLMVGATLCWSSAGVLVRSMNINDPWEITFWRSIFMALFVAGWIWQQHGDAAPQKIRAVGVPGLVSGALFTVMFISFVIALSRTTVANTLIVVSISPFFAALLGWVFLRERVALRTVLAMIAAFLGVCLMFFGAASHDRWVGALVATIVPAAFGLNTVILRKMGATVDMIPAVLIAGIISAMVTLPFALPFEAAGRDFTLLATMGVMQVGLGCVMMTIASRHLTAAEIGLISILEIIFGTLAVWLVVGERPDRAALAGGLIVIAALATDQMLAMRQRTSPAPAVIT
ncbi:MAG: DMT family transporter [Betaproteobacteria bacterium]|nr:MAG: DMT family transporter [Betaproteobacteria bacterium]